MLIAHSDHAGEMEGFANTMDIMLGNLTQLENGQLGRVNWEGGPLGEGEAAARGETPGSIRYYAASEGEAVLGDLVDASEATAVLEVRVDMVPLNDG